MFTVEKTMFVNRPPKEVFEYASDVSNLHQWQDQFLSAEWTSAEPHGVGSTQRSHARFMGRDIESTAEITVWDPPNQLGFKTLSGPIPVEGSQKFEPEGEGTKVTLYGKVEPGGFFKLAEGLVRKQIESQFTTNLEALKKMLETGGG
jgi:uncharacterized membrane protein